MRHSLNFTIGSSALLLILFTAPIDLFGQITTAFDASDTTGCNHFTVTFQDNSTSSGGIIYRYWDFGDGTTLAGNSAAASHTYSQSGLFDVTLTVSNGYDTASLTKLAYIEVFDSPNAQFTISGSNQGCEPFQVQFQDASTPGGAPLYVYFWDFNNGTSSVSPSNQQVTYLSAGNYSPSLLVLDTNGCSDIATLATPITVFSKPKADFGTVGARGSCANPLNVGFTNSSSGLPPLSYNWNFGNGTSTSIPTPQFTYPNNGFYTVSLSVTDGNGCSDTLSKPNYISVGAIMADFSVPDTVCVNQPVEFLNIGSGATYSWSFGNGLSSTQENPTTFYSSQGTYNVMLVTKSDIRCTDFASKSIYVEEVQANWTVTPSYSCNTPLAAQFTDNSIGNIARWNWIFGRPYPSSPKITSTAQNPNILFTEKGIYDDTLVVTSFAGCKDTLVKPADVIIEDVDAFFTHSPTSGCAPISVQFNDLSIPSNTAASWYWDFGNGDTSALQNPLYTFQNPGDYTVTLTVIDSGGCTHEYATQMSFGTPQNASFSPIMTPLCASDIATFQNNSTDTSIIDSYLWLMGDGGSSTSFGADYLYQDTGWMDVTLVVGNDGCFDSTTIDSAVHILGPYAAIEHQTDCDSILDVQFISNLIGGTSFYWDFGDSSPLNTNSTNPLHSYPSKNQYTVMFHAEDSISGCAVDKAKTIFLRDPKALFSVSDSVICSTEELIVDASQSVDAVIYYWDFDQSNGFEVGSVIENEYYIDSGAYKISLRVVDENGCSDTASKRINSYELDIDFISDTLVGCKGQLFNFTELVHHDTSIVTYEWKRNNQLFSTLANPSLNIQYAPRIIDIQLKVVDAIGCSDSLMKPAFIRTTQPPSHFSPSSEDLCIGESLSFSFVPQGSGFQYWYDFDDGSFSNLDYPTYIYSSPGSYSIALTITDSNGCDSTIVKDVTVHALPEASLHANLTDTTCYPAEVVFFDSIADPNVVEWMWIFGDGSSAKTTSVPSATHVYNKPGNFDVTLVVKSIYGCTDTLSLSSYIRIGGPKLKLRTRPRTLCYGAEVEIVARSTGDSAMIFWDFGDGTTQGPTTDLVVPHTFFQEGFLSISVSYTKIDGSCPQKDSIKVYVNRVIADFSMLDYAGCEPFLISPSNLSSGENQYEWNLNGSLIDTVENPLYSIENNGFYTLQLIAANDSTLCRDTLVKSLQVYPKPPVVTSGDVVICQGDSTNLNVALGESYLWSSDYDIENPSSQTINVSPDDTTVFYAEVTSTYGCVGKDSLVVYTMPPPTLLYISPDTSILAGQEYYLEALVDMEADVKWSPNIYVDCSDCTETYVRPTEPMVYLLTFSDTLGCFELDTAVTIDVDQGFQVYIPNSFTPNGDGLNDIFKPKYFGVRRVAHFGVYDRWGKELFRTLYKNEGWDGTFNGNPCQRNQVYVYRVETVSNAGETFEEIGTVFLIGKQQR